MKSIILLVLFILMSSVCKATKQGGVIISNADVVDETILADNF
jgi:hypothetical protein